MKCNNYQAHDLRDYTHRLNFIRKTQGVLDKLTSYYHETSAVKVIQWTISTQGCDYQFLYWFNNQIAQMSHAYRRKVLAKPVHSFTRWIKQDIRKSCTIYPSCAIVLHIGGPNFIINMSTYVLVPNGDGISACTILATKLEMLIWYGLCILIIPNTYWSVTFRSKWPANSCETSSAPFY